MLRPPLRTGLSYLAVLMVPVLVSCASRPAGAPSATTAPVTAAEVSTAEGSAARAGVIEFPGVTVDRARRQVRVACEALTVEAPLEFFCVAAGGPEHESVLRTRAMPSVIHAALLVLDVKPGTSIQYDAATNAWRPPSGPALRVSVEWTDQAGQLVRRDAAQLLRPTGKSDVKPTAQQWLFTGSTQREDGTYLADLTGYVVTLVNFEHALIDVPELLGSDNETLEWQTAPDSPQRGTPVTMILEPADGATTRP